MSNNCVVCHEVEEYPRAPGTIYICGSCVQQLLLTDQMEILEAYNEAEKEEDVEYMWAMRCFIHKPSSKIRMVRRI